MISTLTAAGAPDRNTLPLGAGPLSAGQTSAGPMNMMNPGLAACRSMMASRPDSVRSGGFIAAAYTPTSARIAARNSAGPSSR